MPRPDAGEALAFAEWNSWCCPLLASVLVHKARSHHTHARAYLAWATAGCMDSPQGSHTELGVGSRKGITLWGQGGQRDQEGMGRLSPAPSCSHWNPCSWRGVETAPWRYGSWWEREERRHRWPRGRHLGGSSLELWWAGFLG